MHIEAHVEAYLDAGLHGAGTLSVDAQAEALVYRSRAAPLDVSNFKAVANDTRAKARVRVRA